MTIVRAAPAQRIIVVTGHYHHAIAAAARGPRTAVVRAPRFHEGMGASLSAALARRRPGERQALLFLADMPFVPPGLGAELVHRMGPGERGVRPVWRGRPGHPVVLRLPVRSLPTGDAGPGREQRLRGLPSPAGCVVDIDSPAANRHAANQVAKRALERPNWRREAAWKT